ncbi:MAG: glycoside hydrolase family 26 protein [Actinomycetota bacterium]
MDDARVRLPFAFSVELPPPSVPASGAYFGAYVNPDAAGGQTQQEVTGFEAMIGRKLRVDHHYRSWDSSFDLHEPGEADEGWDVSNGRIPMISQSESGSTTVGILDAINSGAEDRRIIDRARRIRDFGHPLFYRLFWEMNGDWNAYNETLASTPGTHDGTEKYVRAWRRVHSLFQQEGATNAAFVWCPNAKDKPQTSTNHWTNYYPGDAYVDWVCADGYNRAADNGSSWKSFADIFRGVYDDYPQKPFMVGETSSTENGGDKAQWIRDAHNYLKASMPRARGFLWFHRGLEPGSSDWRVDTSSSSLQAYREMGADPYLQR